MNRLTKSEVNTIKKLIKNGFSLNRISKEMNTSKSSIYYWYRQFSKNKIKNVVINRNLEEEIGEIVGAFCGDGNFYLGKKYTYRIRFFLSGNELEYSRNLNRRLLNIFGKSGNILKYSNLIIIDIFGKDIINFIKSFVKWDNNRTKSIELVNKPEKYSNKFLIGFCRGLFDTEGWIVKNNLMINCYSKNLMKNLSCSLNILEIPHLLTTWKRRDSSSFAVFLKKENTIKYIDKIGSSNPRKIKRVLPTGISGKAF